MATKARKLLQNSLDTDEIFQNSNNSATVAYQLQKDWKNPAGILSSITLVTI